MDEIPETPKENRSRPVIRTCVCTLVWQHGDGICERCNYICDDDGGYIQLMPVPYGSTIIFDDDEIIIRKKKTG